MTSDFLFNLALERMPKPLASAMIEHALTNPAVHEAKVRKVTEGLGRVSQQLFLLGLVLLVGFGRLLAVAVRQLQVWMWSLPGPRPVKKFRTLRWVQSNWFRTVRWMMFPSFLTQHTHMTTSRIHIHHFHADTARIALPLSVVLIHTSSLPNATPSAPGRRALKIGAVGSTVDTCSPSSLIEGPFKGGDYRY